MSAWTCDLYRLGARIGTAVVGAPDPAGAATRAVSAFRIAGIAVAGAGEIWPVQRLRGWTDGVMVMDGTGIVLWRAATGEVSHAA